MRMLLRSVIMKPNNRKQSRELDYLREIHQTSNFFPNSLLFYLPVVSEIKQKNEGGWGFNWDEESLPGSVILNVELAKYLDSSLVDVDIHPTYVSIIIKSKVYEFLRFLFPLIVLYHQLLRLRLPTEVKVSESKCQRSKTTGVLKIIMPEVESLSCCL